MTPEERQMLADLFERVKTAGATPRDADAEALINDSVRAAPFGPYVLSQTVLVQQRALEAAAHRIAELEAATRQGAEQSQEHGSFLGNLGKTIFGGGAPAAPPRPSYDASAYQRGCSGAESPAAATRRSTSSRRRPTAATRTSSSIPARRASRTPTSTSWTTRRSTARTTRPMAAAAATTTSEGHVLRMAAP